MKKIDKWSTQGLILVDDVVRNGPNKSPKTTHFPDALFLHFPWRLTGVFGRKVLCQTAKIAFFGPEVLIQRSQSCVGKGPNQRNTQFKEALGTP